MYTYDAWLEIHAHELEMSCLFFSLPAFFVSNHKGFDHTQGGEGLYRKSHKASA